ncbi:MAG TPA: undecaprenyldiphospho-muramoylpentapeptide beta-N-acetylglucosaminyltransferase [Verrucomicrobiae bacterium]|nr:undecaprenyldiphospho-muramoylpentapeptide beta-N-acetylglucosaminyltransferase [Verrucomicrobiae bacterium]
MPKPLVAVACGGTGGHLFPGIAVGEELMRRGCEILLLVSEKEIDEQAVKSAYGMRVVALPAVGLQRGQFGRFVRGFSKSFMAVRQVFAERPPRAVVGMGGFACAPPILAGKLFGAATFLHESNSVPGKANRLLAPLVNRVFVGFPQARARLHNKHVLVTGTPVRPQFQPTAPEPCRLALGLEPNRPVVLVMGGSQGAAAINKLVFEALPELRRAVPGLQFLHLTGPNDETNARAQYATQKAKAVVHTFLTEMELALGAATLVVSRAGASSLAELAAMQVPAILVPYPTAADNHQFYNAHAFASAGAAVRIDQADATGENLAALIVKLLQDAGQLKNSLAQWHAPNAASQIADEIVNLSSRHREKSLIETQSQRLVASFPAI